jgi:hypothetical protein
MCINSEQDSGTSNESRRDPDGKHFSRGEEQEHERDDKQRESGDQH